MAETIRDVIIRVAIQQVEAKLKKPDIAPVIAAIEKVKEVQKKATDEIRLRENIYRADEIKMREVRDEHIRKSRFKEIALIERVAVAMRRNAAEQVQIQEQMVAANQLAARRVTLGFLNATEGAMRLSRGIVLLSEHDKDLERLARVLISFQAGFDVLAGGVKIVQGLTRALVAYRLAAIAAGASMAPLAAAAAVVATLGATIGISQFEKNKKAARREAQAKLQETEGNVFVREVRDETNIMEMRHDLYRIKTAERVLDLNKQNAILERQRTREKEIGTKPGDTPESLRAERIAIGEEQVNTRKRIGELLIEERTRLTELYRLEKMRHETIKEMLKDERERVKGQQAGFGRLTAMDQGELLRIAKKAKSGGKLTAEELEFQESKGGEFGARESVKEFAKRGAKFREEYHKALGGTVAYEANEPVKQLIESLRRAQRPEEGGGGIRPLAEMIEKMNEQIKEAGEEVVKAQDELNRQRRITDTAIIEAIKRQTEEAKWAWGEIQKVREQQAANRRAMVN